VELSREVLARLNAGGTFDTSDDLLLAEQLSQRLGKAIDVHLNRFSPSRYRDLLSPIIAKLDHRVLEGATVVDLGCGSVNPFTFSFLLLLLGAKRAYAVDVEPIQDLEVATRALASAVSWMLLDPGQILGADILPAAKILQSLDGFSVPRLAVGDPNGIAAERLEHRRESVYELSIGNGEADAVFSVSLLEHLDRVEAALKSLRRITKRGGVGVHVVDFVDHRIYAGARFSPYEFLKEPPGTALVHGCNRVRCHEFADLFDAHDFAVETIETWAHLAPPTDGEWAQFAEPYRSMPRESISTNGARFIVRRR
jgi:SAM-dependent methyltransferase